MPPSPSSPRLLLIDLARGIALIGMVVFHSVFDLEFFGLVPPGTSGSGFWALFARAVAGSFVFLAGVSLVLSARGGTGRPGFWRHFWRGTGLVALAALVVSAATFAAFPQAFVFFGILHLIAVARVVGLAFLKAPAWLCLVAGVAVWALPYLVTSPAFDPRTLAWIGFSDWPPLSMDFEPLFPWLGPALLGMAFAKSVPIAALALPAPARALAWAGRHSLAIYLLHQPVLLGLCWLAFG